MSAHPGMADPISNDDLQPGDVPPRGSDWSAIVRFAQTFNGYLQTGGFHQCSDIANHRRECESLSDLRACLFFEYRRHNHFGYPPDSGKMRYIYDLLDRIRKEVTG